MRAFYVVGPGGIGPPTHPPQGCILPLYYGPKWFRIIARAMIRSNLKTPRAEKFWRSRCNRALPPQCGERNGAARDREYHRWTCEHERRAADRAAGTRLRSPRAAERKNPSPKKCPKTFVAHGIRWNPSNEARNWQSTCQRRSGRRIWRPIFPHPAILAAFGWRARRRRRSV